MRRVLMVSPHFPPDSSAASHRVRLLAPHLRAVGWATDRRHDRSVWLRGPPRPRSRSAGAAVIAHRARAGVACSPRRGGSDSAIWVCAPSPGCGTPAESCWRASDSTRCSSPFIRSIRRCSGRRSKAEFGVPFVLDYQDPWVGAWGRSVGGGPTARADWKSRASRQLGTWLEPRAVGAADALVAVSQGTLDGIVERMPAAARAAAGRDPARVRAGRLRIAAAGRSPHVAHFDPADGLVHCAMSARCCPPASSTLRLLLRALDRARRDDPAGGAAAAAFLRHQQSVGVGSRIACCRSRANSASRMRSTETPGRLDYLDALVSADASVGDSAARQLRAALHREQALSCAAGAAADPRALPRGEQRRVDSAARRRRADGARRHVRRTAAPRRPRSARSHATCAALAAQLRVPRRPTSRSIAWRTFRRAALARQLAAVFDRVAA